MILQLAVSRQREYLADATAAKLLGEGRPLAFALESLRRGVEAVPVAVNPATASLYIANPLSGAGMASLFSTHPPMDARIDRLRAIDRAAGNVW
jgi:heat shock protein HtpX